MEKQAIKIKKLSGNVSCDIADYINMRERNIRSLFIWNIIKHMKITESGCTLWQVSIADLIEHDLANSNDTIGAYDEPRMEFIKMIFNECKK